jgi:hypothetical protein
MPLATRSRPETNQERRAAPPVRRRNPVRIAIAMSVTAVGALLIGYAFMSLSDSVGVVVANQTIERGTTITSDDLAVAKVSLDPSISVIPADELAGLLGQSAAVEIVEGSLLSAAEITAEPIPGVGEALVNLALQPGQYPPLHGGAPIRVVSTASRSDDPPVEAPRFIEATVVDSSPTDDGLMIVNVLVPSDQAGLLATRAATGRIAVVLDPAVRP